MEKKKLELSVVEPKLKEMLSLNFAYLDRAIKDLKSIDLKEVDKDNELKKQQFNSLHTFISCWLDVTHRAYPLCYDLFEENKDNLDNAYKMFKRFEAAQLLKPCPCDYCKENPIDNKEMADIKEKFNKPSENTGVADTCIADTCGDDTPKSEMKK